MVTRYDVISSRWSSHFWVKVHVFSTFSTIKYCVISGRWLCLLKHHKFSCYPYSVIFLAVRWHEESRSLDWEAGRAIASPNFSFPGIWNSRGWQIKRLVPSLQCKYKIHHTPCGHFSIKTTSVCPSVYIMDPNGVNLPILVPVRLLPRPFSVNAFWWRIRDERSDTRSDHVTRNAWAVTFLPIHEKVPWTDASITEKCSFLCWNALNPSDTCSLLVCHRKLSSLRISRDALDLGGLECDGGGQVRSETKEGGRQRRWKRRRRWRCQWKKPREAWR